MGEVVTYRDLLYGLLLPSGADAAKALARNIAGSEEAFIEKMNTKAAKLRLKSTHFSTVIGLDDTANFSTAKEVATIFKEALKNEEFKTIITTQKYTSSDGKIELNSTIQSNAKKFNIEIPYVLGGKTGTTTDAGLCLATIAEAKDVNYMLITLGATYDKKSPHNIEDAKIIYDYFIENYGNQLVVNKEKSFMEIKTKYTDKETLKLYPTKNITLYLKNDYNKNGVKYIYNGKGEITPFNKKGEKLGTLNIYYQDKLLDTQEIILKENLKFNFLSFVKEEFIKIIIAIVGLIVIIISIVIIKKKLTKKAG